MEKRKVILLDGAVGTSIWEKTEDKLPVWNYNLRNPAAVRELADEYIAAGARIILANTFGANGPAVRYASDYTVEEVVSAGVRIAREAAAGTGVQVALSAGPLTQLLEPYGRLKRAEVRQIYQEMLGAGMAEHPDLIMLQTFMDVEMMRIAAEAAMECGVPVFCTMTFERVGKTMMGNSVEDVLQALTPLGIGAVGINCSLGPDLALPILREFSEKTDLPLVFKPNAGKPILKADGSAPIPYSAEHFVQEIAPALEYATYLGGCCGSNPAYIRRMKEAFAL